jgi:NRPS condensation-like uncharacterized protein
VERLLGSFERSFWLYDRVRPVHFAMAAKLRGAFSLEQLRFALTQLQNRHPLLRVKIAVAASGLPQFVEDEVEIPIRVVTRNNADSWRQELAAEMSRSFDWSVAPLVRVVLLQEGKDAELILSCHHSIGDGFSGAVMLRDIVRGLSDEKLLKHSLAKVEPIEKVLPNMVLLDVEAGGEVLSTPAGVSTRSLPDVQTAVLSEQLTGNLIIKSRQEGTTVHGAIGAACLLTMAKHRGASQLKCLSPINVRSHLQLALPDDVGLYIGYGLTDHELSYDSALWAVARSMKSQLAKFTSAVSLQQFLVQRQQFMATNPTVENAFQVMQQARSYDLLLTNLGRITFDQQFGAIEIAEFYGPAVMTGMDGELAVGVSTWGAQLSLVALSPATSAGKIAASVFLDEVCHLLTQISEA